MHMGDALVSVNVATAVGATSAFIGAYSIRRLKEDLEDNKTALMGVLGAFVFAAEMINFTIPGTGASGHLGGGMLLAILLGPYAGFLTMAAILLIQALFFADGGLLAYGCNVFNLGFLTCYVSYNFIYKIIIKENFNKKKLVIATMLSSIIGLQLGSLAVVLQTVLSAKTELSFSMFLLAMQPIHLAIGIMEGIVTTAIVIFIYKTRPEILHKENINNKRLSFKKLLVILSVLVVITGAGLSLFASSNPDGLEWSILKVASTEEIESTSSMQEKISILPGYSFKEASNKSSNEEIGTSFSGLIGSIITVTVLILIGAFIKIISTKMSELKK